MLPIFRFNNRRGSPYFAYAPRSRCLQNTLNFIARLLSPRRFNKLAISFKKRHDLLAVVHAAPHHSTRKMRCFDMFEVILQFLSHD
jgi:hypothetical protein